MHCPLCYREPLHWARLDCEFVAQYTSAPGVAEYEQVLNNRAGQLRDALTPFGASVLGVIHTVCG